MIRFIQIFALILPVSTLYAQSFMQPSQRATTSRDAAIDPELHLRQQQIHQDSLQLKYSWHWCDDTQEFSVLCQRDPRFSYRDSTSSVGFSPILELGYRDIQSLDNQTTSTTYGGILQGHLNYLSFWVDARINSESHSLIDGLDRTDLSWDREFIDIQKSDTERTSNNFTFISFARYRAAFTLDTDVGRLGFRRETVHWGPGVYLNLSFNHQAVPFNHVFYQGEIGPVRVWTLWGRLSRSEGGVYQQGRDTKSIYAHRYEVSLGSRVTLGVTEQLIMFNQEEPWAFVPVVPLFMEKGQGVERDNNGNLAFDITYKQPGLGLLYSEFLIDDMQEPTTLFDDFWGNRWAWMAGLHLSPYFAPKFGFLAEYSRVEPWVYGHYVPLTAQSSNGDTPLGNPYGPNSQAIVLQPYYKTTYSKARHFPSEWSLGVKSQWVWKGDDPGSSLADGSDLERKQAEADGIIAPNKKAFIKDVPVDFSLGPIIRVRSLGLQWDLEGRFFGQDDQIITRISYQY